MEARSLGNQVTPRAGVEWTKSHVTHPSVPGCYTANPKPPAACSAETSDVEITCAMVKLHGINVAWSSYAMEIQTFWQFTKGGFTTSECGDSEVCTQSLDF